MRFNLSLAARAAAILIAGAAPASAMHGGFGHIGAMGHMSGMGRFGGIRQFGGFSHGPGFGRFGPPRNFVRAGYRFHRFHNRFVLVGLAFPVGYYDACYVSEWTPWGWGWAYVCD